ncbi:GDSL-type esterase/lipase family protein [Desertivirga brevis]|uniref:GDSL-type esterase/lipase family protein n=1 Tax=Desertivirga brevis TaxID=2810310 RepID=UPI001A9757D8|nr:GDSL-type esterase/lipase family protein [Pedobacter sp. SYSU D00873]
MRFLKAFSLLTLSWLLAFLFSMGIVSTAQAQETRSHYWSTIQKFKEQDRLQTPPKKAILFVGSSSFTNWHFAQEMFPDHKILNRGFGGSQLPDVKQYFEQVNYPPKLKQIVVYAGDNDIASGQSAQEVLNRFKDVYYLIRKDLPKVEISYLSIKGCPGRARSIPVVKEANQLIKSFLAGQKNTSFIDIYHATMIAEDKPMDDIYVEDGVHMNRKGYEIWAATLKPYLKK